MNIPDKIINLITPLPVAIQGQIYYMVIEYMRSQTVNTEFISAEAAAEFYKLKIQLDRVIHRRQKAREYRQRRKERLAALAFPAIPQPPQEEEYDITKDPYYKKVQFWSKMKPYDPVDDIYAIADKYVEEQRRRRGW